jgi:hypothetical protein
MTYYTSLINIEQLYFANTEIELGVFLPEDTTNSTPICYSISVTGVNTSKVLPEKVQSHLVFIVWSFADIRQAH